MLVKLLTVLLLCFLIVKSDNFNSENVTEQDDYDNHIASVLTFLNSKPNNQYDYKKGRLINAHKTNVTEINIEVDVDCINEDPEIPCNERTFICHAFVIHTIEKIDSYDVLGDVRCNPKVEPKVERIEKLSSQVVDAINTQHPSDEIELINDELPQSRRDVVAVRPDTSCLGCPFELATDAEGIGELKDVALKHIESENVLRYKVIEIIRLEQQIVAGVKYMLLIKLAPTYCAKQATISVTCPVVSTVEPLTCKIVFFEQPWISTSKHIINNNCTVSQEFTVIQNAKLKDDTHNEILINDGNNNTPKDPVSRLQNYDEIAESGNLDQEIDNRRLAELESQVLLASMFEDPKTSRVESPKDPVRNYDAIVESDNLEQDGVSKTSKDENPNNPVPPTEPHNFMQNEGLTVDEKLPIIKDIDGSNQKSASTKEPIQMNTYLPVVDEKQPIVTIYDHQSEENFINKNSEISENLGYKNYLPIQKRLKREDSNSNSNSDSNSNSNSESNELLTPTTTKVEIVKRDVSNSSEENSNDTSEEKNNLQRVKREKNEDSSSSSSSSEEDNGNGKGNKKGECKSNEKCDGRKENHNKQNGKDNGDSSSSSSSSSSSEEGNGDNNNNRNKRSIGQMEKITHDEKVIVRDLADFAAATLDNIDDDHHKRVILQILGAKKLKLDGIYYQIILRLGVSHCLEGDHNENCREKLFTNLTKICKVQVHVEDDHSNPKVVKSQCQNVKKDENDRNRTNYSRYKRGVPGGVSPMSRDDPKVQKFVQATLDHLDSVSGSGTTHNALEVISATSQVVAGAKYVIKVKIGESQREPEICTITVWERVWLNSREYSVKCNDKTHTFSSGANRRRKRELFESYNSAPLLGDERDISVDIPVAKKLVKIALDYLSVKSNLEGHYQLQKINKVTKRIVAGTLWNIQANIALCSNYDEIQPLLPACTSKDEHTDCHFIIFNQPWLKRLKIDIKCAGDNNTYSFEHSDDSTKLNSENVSVEKAFTLFALKYNKIYGSTEEYNFRLKVFRDNLNKIALLNKYEKGTAQYGVNQFADMTEKEFSQSHGYRPDLRNENEISLYQAAIPKIQLPTEFDWRLKSAVTGVKDQGICGSCWAFSVTGNVEGQYAIKHGKLLEFSEQELVDCDKMDEGCNGGLMDNAYRAIEKLGGLESESDYPYEGEDEKCHFDKTKVKVQLTGALNISHNETDMAKWLVQYGPISIGINANAMQFYAGGVSHPWKSLCNPKNLDHGVLIVGYGIKTYALFNKTLPYWIVKNSWGKSWGEQGYYRVYRGDGTCGLNQMASSAIVA